MALSKVNFNSLNLTPTASKTVVFNSNNNGIEAGDVGGSMVLISELTASSSATLSFTSGIDSTYKEYIFKFIDIHPSSTDVNGESFKFNFSIDGGSNYNVAKTSTFFYALNTEADSNSFSYYNGGDLGNSTGDQIVTSELGGDNDQSVAGFLHLFNPSDTVGVKHFIAQFNEARASDGSEANYLSGYANTTSAINAVQFSMTRSGETIQSGSIKLYGIS